MPPIVFCDFDGTITAVETFVAMFKEFAPEVSAQLLPQMYAQQVTLRQGVRQILESIPSAWYGEILEFTRSQPTRPGFVELLDFLDLHHVPLVVVSGGLRGMVEVVLGDLVQRVYGIHAIEVNTQGNYLQIYSPYEDGSEMVAKVNVINHYEAAEQQATEQQTTEHQATEQQTTEHQATEAIAIGDSLTDLNMALYAPLVFARDRLAHYLDESQKRYIPWNDFFDVRDHLSELWSANG
jgi:2-hydroxy-3-keto-5-methylthiopentenyl-1-phosphate phosphatase